jgi:hypothetical protein
MSIYGSKKITCKFLLQPIIESTILQPMRRIQQSSNLSQTQSTLWQSVVHVRHQETILIIRSKQDNQSAKRRKFHSYQQLINICMNSFLHLRTLNLRNTGTPIGKILRIKLPVDRRDLCRSTAGTSSTGHKMSSTIKPGLKALLRLYRLPTDDATSQPLTQLALETTVPVILLTGFPPHNRFHSRAEYYP